MLFKMIKAVIFDLDDTLISEYEYIQSGFRVIANFLSEKYRLSSEDVFLTLLNLFHKNPKNVFNRILDFYQIEYTMEDIKELIFLYRNHLPNISLYDDAKFILEYLSERNLKLGLITDGYKETQRNKLKILNISHYFDCIIVTDELGREYWKPHAKPYQQMRADLEVEFGEMIYIGDNLSKDFITAKQLGMKTIHIKRNEGVYKDLNFDQNYQAHQQVKTLEQIINFI